MNIKKKFQSIDQSQLSESQKEILGKIKTATKDFTITDEKALQKVDGALDNIIEKLKKTNPQAIKGEEKKEESKPKKEAVKKEPKSETKTSKEPKKEIGGKRTIFSIAKEIRKSDENWEDAKKRAKKIMEGEREETTKKMKTETDKLLAFIKRRKELEGLSGTSIKKDSKIEAKAKGRRISKNGKRYYEYRDNRTDRLAPNFADKIYLAEGGYANKGVYVETLDEEIDMSDDGKVRARKTQEGKNLSYGELREKHGASPEALAFANGGYVVIAKSEKGGGFVMSKPTSKVKAEKLKSLLPKIDGESNEVMTLNKASKLSGLVGKEYLKYADGGAIIGTPETPLARGLGMDYTGLVGETGAMSSGELFADGGNVIDAFQMRTVRGVGNKPTEVLTNEQKVEFALGGSLSNHGLKQGDQVLKTMSGGIQKVKTKSGDIVYVNLANGYRGTEPPLPFANGGYANERRHVNKSQKYEVRYAKNKPNRSGYKGKRSFDDGGMIYKDLFQDYKNQPKELAEIVDAYMEKFEEGNYDYADSKKFLEEVESVGYTFDYGLDNEPYGLRPVGVDLSQVEGYEDYNEEEAFAEGGFMTDPNFGDFQNQVYATGGGVKSKKSPKELRKEYLEKLGQKEADVWDKIGAESGSQIRNSDKMLKAYAEGVEEMLQKEGVGKGSFDQEDYDFYTDENWHLFNDFLVWNGYYEPEMTKTEKEWREKYYADPKKRNYVSNPSVIKISGSSKSKSTNYVPKGKIATITIVKDGKEIVLESKDVLNGVNLYDGGGKLKNDHVYFAKRYVKEVITENGDKLKPSNGYWVKKSALKDSKKEEYKVMSNQGIFYKKGVKTYWYVENSKGQTINNTTGKPYKGKEMTNYYFLNEEGAKKFAEKLNNSSFEGGGKTTFNEKATAIAKKFEGKKVEPKYQKEYGKTYEKAEAKEVGNKIAGAQKAKYDSKMSGGGSTKRGGAMVLAKQIRKDGESWASALKRANEQMRNK